MANAPSGNVLNGDPCSRCGEVHTRCSGHAKIREGGEGTAALATPVIGIRPCMRYPILGAKVCKSHGGQAPHVKAAGAARIAEAQARKALETYGRPIETTADEALLDEVKWTAGHVAWLRARIQELDPDALTWGVTKREDHQATEFPGINITESAAVHALVDLHLRERRHLLDACKTAIGAGIAERQVRLAERLGDQIVEVIQAILGDLGLSPEQSAQVPEVVPRHLRLIAGGVA